MARAIPANVFPLKKQKGASRWHSRQTSKASIKLSSRTRALSQSLRAGSWPSLVDLWSADLAWQIAALLLVTADHENGSSHR